MANPKKIRNLEAILQKKEESVGSREVEFAWKGKHYSFPHPSFAPDEWQETLSKAETPRENGVALLGEKKYDEFRADGGQASFLMHLLEDVRDEMQGTTPDGVPTPSSTS